MIVIKKFFKIALKFILVFLGLLLIYGLSAFLLPKITVNKNMENAEDITIYILSNGVHTDIVLPVKTDQINWLDYVKPKHTLSKDSTFNYLAFGWGDKGFYLHTPEWKDLKAKTALRAAFGVGESAMHTTFYRQLRENKNCKKVLISHEQYQELSNFIFNTFQISSSEFLHISTTATYGKNDAFYEANGSYSLFYTCNTWANQALKVSGIKCCFWTPHDQGILSKYD